MNYSCYTVSLESAEIEPEHPYTIIFKGYAPSDKNKLFTFKYGGPTLETDATMTDEVKRDFELQLEDVFGVGIKFDIDKVREQLKAKSRFVMKG